MRPAPEIKPDAAAIAAGQAIYKPRVLRIYDLFVHGLSNHLLWRCPTARLRALYDRNVSARHLDIGVGSGYFLDRALFPVARPEITLFDLNENALAFAADRLKRYRPRTVRGDVFAPPPAIGPFDSIGLCYLLHCLPGAIPAKTAALDLAAALAAPGARVFGATLLQGDAPRNRAAQRLMNVYNRKGVFSNAGDRFEDLEAALGARFSDLRLERVGCAAVFEARAA